MTARWVLRRLTRALVVVWGAFSVAFLAGTVLPGDPVALALAGRNGFGAVAPDEVDRLRQELGYDRPILEQYVTALDDAVRGDLGESVQTGRPVTEMLVDAAGPTAQLAVLALVLAAAGGLALGVLTVVSHRRRATRCLAAVPVLLISVPPFWVGLVLIWLFSLQLRVLPSVGADGPLTLVLPALTLALPASALIGQVLGSSLRTALAEPWADVVRSTGASRWRCVRRHGLRNAAVPALTVTGLLVGGLLGGVVVVETVFSRPGLGRVMSTAVTAQDMPVVQGTVILAATSFALTTMVVDLLVPAVDPRLRPAATVTR